MFDQGSFLQSAQNRPTKPSENNPTSTTTKTIICSTCLFSFVRRTGFGFLEIQPLSVHLLCLCRNLGCINRIYVICNNVHQESNTAITGACANIKQTCWGTCHGHGRQVTVPFFLNSRLIFLSLSIVFMNVCFSTLLQMVCNTNFANHLTCWTFFKCMCFFVELFNTQSFRDFLVLTLTFVIASEEKKLRFACFVFLSWSSFSFLFGLALSCVYLQSGKMWCDVMQCNIWGNLSILPLLYSMWIKMEVLA